MVWDRRFCRALVLALGLTFAATVAAEAQPALEPKAIDLLKAMSERLAAAKAMSFSATVTYESPSRLGPPLAYTTRSEVLVQRPDRLRVVTPGDGPASEFYLDGKTMSAFAPKENLVAIAPAPATIDAALKAAFQNAAIYFPFSDVVIADPYAGMTERLVRAFYVGQSEIVGGTKTDIVAVVGAAVFIQVWIGADDKLPRKMRAIYKGDRQQLRHDMDLSNWQLDPATDADAFVSSKAAGATKVEFARPDPQHPVRADTKAKRK